MTDLQVSLTLKHQIRKQIRLTTMADGWASMLPDDGHSLYSEEGGRLHVAPQFIDVKAPHRRAQWIITCDLLFLSTANSDPVTRRIVMDPDEHFRSTSLEGSFTMADVESNLEALLNEALAD